MTKAFLLCGSISAACAVILGAFGAHALRSRLSPESLHTFQTAVLYHMFHSLGLLIVGIVAQGAARQPTVTWAGWAMLGGIVLFSGSLYALGITGIRPLGMVTPFGGVLLIVSWVLLALSFGQ